MRRLLRTAFRLACPILPALLFSEFAFRRFLVEHHPPVSDRDLSVALGVFWPGSFPASKAAGTVRILGLSDSFGQAGGPENYHYLLERRLRELGFPVEVVNLSIGGYSPAHEAAVLKRFGRRYQPDLVLHGFCVGNDFHEGAEPFWSFKGIPLPVTEGRMGLLPWNYALLSWLRRRQMIRAAKPGPGMFEREAFLKIVRRRLEACRVLPDSFRRGRAMRGVRDIREAARELGARYAMVLHPDEFQVDERLFEEALRSGGLDPTLYDRVGPQRFLMEDCRGDGSPCLDLLALFQEEHGRGSLFLPRDTHYNAKGNELAARALADFLVREGLLGK